MSQINASYHYWIESSKDSLSDIQSSSEFDSLKKAIENVLNALGCNNEELKIDVRFIWVDLVALMNDESFDKLLPPLHTKDKNNLAPLPTIYIGSQPIAELIKNSDQIWHKKIAQLDNNIWTYYIHIQEKNSFENHLKEILREIEFHYDLGLFDLQVSHEYLDYYRRMVRQNYLEGGHSTQVIPQVYTSRNVLKIKQEDADKIKNNTTIKVLLVDDFAAKKMNDVGSKNSCTPHKTIFHYSSKNEGGQLPEEGSKAYIFLKMWNEIPILKDKNVYIDLTCLTKPEIVEEIKNEYFDIILLDYNFNEQNNGVDFFEELTKSKVNGPFGKLWVIPVSSFSTAFIDEMRNKGLGFISEKYKLSAGADFIATPYLFFDYFTKMIIEIINTADVQQAKADIKELLSELSTSKNWKDISKYSESLRKHFTRRKELNALLLAQEGILKSLKDLNINDPDQFRKQLNFYEQLLYNLAYRNYEGNEEIMIFYDLLKKS